MTPFRHMLHQKQDDQWVYVADLDFVDGWAWAPQWLQSSRDPERIDWGTLRYQISKNELLKLIKPAPRYGIRPEWDAPFIAAEERQNKLLGSLPADGAYAVDWQEGA